MRRNNTEVEVLLTFTNDTPGRLVSQTAASGKEFTLRERHSFIELPEGYVPRRADPRVGFFGVTSVQVPQGLPIGAERGRLE